MIISSILGLISIGTTWYLNNNVVNTQSFDSGYFGAVNNSVLLVNEGTGDNLRFYIDNGYDDTSFGNFVNFYFSDYEVIREGLVNYDKVLIDLTFRDDNNNEYTGSFQLNSHNSWEYFSVGANTFIAEGSQGINCSVTPLYFEYETDNLNSYHWGSGKETNLYTQPQYLNNMIKPRDNFDDKGLILGLHIEYKDSSVMLTAGDQEYYYSSGYNEGVRINTDYYENQVIPQLETEYQAEISQTAQTEYARGYAEAENTDSAINSIFSGILSISLVPINMFLAMLNWEIFGINVGAFVSATLSVLVIVMLFRFIFKGKASE